MNLTLTRPDDCHVHVREGRLLPLVLAHTARQFSRAVIMPNLRPPVTTVARALAYSDAILSALSPGVSFTPLMTLYLTAETSIETVCEAVDAEAVLAFKLYPAGATTHSDAGVADLEKIYPVLAAMEHYDLPLLVHGEVTDPDCDIFDRERLFIERHLTALVREFPRLRIVLEHVTTAEAVQFVMAASEQVAATITPQHLLYNRNALLVGGVHPHHY